MADPLLLQFSYVDRRPAGFRVVHDKPVARADFLVVSRIPKPSVPQFSGTLSPARVQLVSLQRRGQKPMETVQSDVNGYFEFNGWYYPHSDYEFLVHGDDLYKAAIFPLQAPVEHRWNGNPVVNDSTVLI
jgi:hypothetical protein